jgi:secreted trypsin-like serine protease
VKRLLTLAVAGAAALVLALPGTAITNGQLDGELHPSVGGFMVFANGRWQLICSGTLISTRVFLTASHCTSYAEDNGWPVAVSFDSTDVENTADIRPATSVTNPDYHAPYANDVSLLLLTTPVSDRTPMALAPVGYLDGLKASGAIKDAVFTNVGYGTHEKGQGKDEDFVFDGDRWYSFSSYSSLNKELIHLHQKENADEGGACYGDSGGPTLSGSLIVAVVSTGDVPCWSTGVNTRVDTSAVRAFLAPYLALH